MTLLRRIFRHLSLQSDGRLYLCVLIWCLALPLPHVCGTGSEIEIHGDKVSEDQNGSGGNRMTVQKHWGIPDTTAYVGKLFRHHIPSDAFVGNVDHFQVRDAYGDELPKWLYFSNSTATVEGLPTSQDIGRYHITVTAFGVSLPNGQANYAQDVFAINVVAELPDSPKLLLLKGAGASPNLVRCGPADGFTTMSISLDTNFVTMDPKSRVDLATKVIEKFGISEDSLQFLPMEFGRRRLYEGNTIMAGPGNALQKQSAGMIVHWQLDCGHVVDHPYEDVVAILEKNAQDGTLARYLAVPVIGWHLEYVPPPSAQNRQKRQTALPLSTPAPWPQPKTWNTEASWETDEVSNRLTDEEGPIPDSRIIPTMASPTVTFLYPSTSHHIRHHHGTVRGGHHHVDHGASASLPVHYIRGTPVLSTPIPSPVYPSVITEPYVEATKGVLWSSMTSASDTELLASVTSPFTEAPDDTISYPTAVLRPTATWPDTGTVTKTSGARQNFRPVVKNRIPKLVLIAGKLWRYQIPRLTFFDFEDNHTRGLKLFMYYPNGTSIHHSSWIQFNSQKQEIYAIPLDVHIGKWEFVLEAMDSDGASVKDEVEINVRQHQSSRTFQHEFVMHLKYDKWRFAVALNWQMRLVEKLASFFKDLNESSIVVHSFTKDSPVLFTWTFENLQRQYCPTSEVLGYWNNMTTNGEGTATKLFRNTFAPDFRVSRVTVKFLGHCRITDPPTTNFKPVLRNPVDHINATVGRLLLYNVSVDTFFDQEDGDVTHLKLLLRTIDSKPVPQSSWIRLDKKTFIGLPLPDDVGSEQYQLVAMDKEGLSASDALVITVLKPPETKPPSVEFSLHINHDFHNFTSDLKNRLMVLDKLASVFNDLDARHITVRSIGQGSVVFNWINNTLQGDTCPEAAITQLVKKMRHDNGTVSHRLRAVFLPEFNVTNVAVIPLGVCLAALTPTKTVDSVLTAVPPTIHADHAYSDDDIYITTIIPAVVIATMLLVAAIIACVLYRKKRKGKMTMEDNSTFVNKGIPIIFADELEEKPDPAKSPVIMKEEKPPLPPPDYRHSSSSASPSTPPLSQKRGMEHLEDFGLDQSENTPPYQPPPPFTSNRDSRLNRPKHTPTYRLPPPYVPP